MVFVVTCTGSVETPGDICPVVIDEADKASDVLEVVVVVVVIVVVVVVVVGSHTG